MKSINPANGAVLKEYTLHTWDEVDRILDSAADSFRTWGYQPVARRTALIARVGELLEERKEALAMLMTDEMGKPIGQARAEAEKCAWACRYYAENAEKFLAEKSIETDAKRSFVRYEPLGVVFGVMPWNFPFWQVLRACIPAMTTGNTFVLKHARNVTGCALACEKLFRDAGAPEGVFTSIVVGSEIAEKVIEDERVAGVTLTGSTGVGRKIASSAGQYLKPVVLELGGSDPFIILKDADLDRALETAMTSRFQNNGQSCIAAKRWIIEDPIYDLFVRKAAEKVKELVCDDPAFESTDVGPLAREDLLETLEQQVESTRGHGARCLAGGSRKSGGGYFYEPTFLADVEPGMSCFDEETFGPVAVAVRAKDTDHAIRLANKTPFGLGSAIWTDARRAEELVPRIQAGHVAVNGMTKSDPRLPFGGIKDSGLGRELSIEGQHAFANIKSVWIGE